MIDHSSQFLLQFGRTQLVDSILLIIRAIMQHKTRFVPVIFFRKLPLVILSVLAWLTVDAHGREPDQVIDLWPGLAPGETTAETGTALAKRPAENPPATRIKNITKPQIHVFLPRQNKRTGTAVLIFPGGGYNYVVIDKEGSEAASWLNSLGVTAFVIHYRTKAVEVAAQHNPILPAFSERPLQDGQRAISLIRDRASQWKLQKNKIGVLGFSAGGQLAALLATRFDARAYPVNDRIDHVSCRPDFALLLYPWQLLEKKTGQLQAALTISQKTAPAFLVHAHNDPHSSLNSAQFYAELKRKNIDAELHIYRNGGHGNGLRNTANSSFPTWPDRAADWMRQRWLLSAE